MKHSIFCLLVVFTFISVQAQSTDEAAVKSVLNSYKAKLEKLDTAGVSDLFVANSKVYEGGKDEGTIQNYLGHHLAPELGHFKSFNFSDYKADVKLNGDYAYATETYLYTIVLKKEALPIKSQGVATSVLTKTPGGWKIEMTHSSFRKLK